MTIYTHISDECLTDASMHNLRSSLENVEAQILETQKTVGFGPFRPTRLIRKSMGRSFRLLAYEERRGEDSVLIFLRILPRSDSDYNWLLENHENSPQLVEQKFICLAEEETKAIYLNKKKSSPGIETIVPYPSGAESGWLYSVFTNSGVNDQDLLVLESRQWVEEMISSKARDFLGVYQGFLNELPISNLESSNSIHDIKYLSDETGRVGILYVFFPYVNQLFLVYPLRGTQQQAEKEQKIKEFKEIFSRAQKHQNPEEVLLRFACRSYPFFMVLDCDAWLDIQKDKEANLALSPEEGELLEFTRSPNIANSSYPLFINGRAGSGKSTILQYLMADYSEYALKQSSELLPLYMTYSSDLLKSARETVRRLLSSHSDRLLDGKAADNEINLILSKTFVVFHDFLLNSLPENLKKGFDPDKFVGYTEFQRLWTAPRGFGNWAEGRKIDVGLAWHIIRSYIKGIRSGRDDDLSTQEFKALPKKRRSVTEESYQFVYERVWLKWYKALNDDEGYWDDQDLVATLLDSGSLKNLNYSAILCDEAQDFTSIELEFILQLSRFSKLKLDAQELRRVPFIFAGDPLQTLNPTGFRWENVQADFYERFCSVLDPNQRANIEINYQELKYNYRSNQGIVNFCNLLQLLRLCLIGGSNIHPQKAWWVEKPVQVIWFDVDDVRTQEQIGKNPEIIKIVNCDLGDETNFVQNDNILSQDERGFEEDIYQNVLSPSRSKGLEFSRVILYRFGESAPDGFESLLTGEVDIHDIPEKCLQYEYFLNRLYVAASRAKRQLLIIDSRENIEKFWRFATNPTVLAEIASHLKNISDWEEHLAYLLQGSFEAWTGETVDIRSQALDYEMQGLHSRDSYLLRQAAISFRSIGEQIKSVRCFALALEIEGRYQKSGDTYREAGLFDDAFEAYWRGQNFESIKELTADYPSLSRQINSRAADFMAQSNAVPQALVAELYGMMSSEESIEYIANDNTWHKVLKEISERINKSSRDNVCNWNYAYKVLETCYKRGVELNEIVLGQIAYRARYFKEAIKHFENENSTDVTEYYDAKAKVEEFPANLIWLRKLDAFSEIVDQWEANPEAKDSISDFSREVCMAVCDAALTNKKYDLALKILQHKEDKARALKLCNALVTRREHNTAIEILQTYFDQKLLESLIRKGISHKERNVVASASLLLLQHYLKDREWETVLDLVEGHYAIPKVDREELVDYFEKEEIFRLLRKVAVNAFSISSELSQETPERQAPISEFLYQNFIAQKSFQSITSAGLSVKAVGAAIERAGRIVNAIRFYESLYSFRRLPEEDLDFVTERLIVNLERHAVYQRKNNQTNQAKDREIRAQDLRDISRIGEKSLPDYPLITSEEFTVDKLHEVLKKDKSSKRTNQQTNWESSSVVCKCSPDRDKWRVEHKELFETVTFSLSDLSIKGDAKSKEVPIHNEFECAAWEIEDWGTTIHVYEIDGHTEIHISGIAESPMVILAN